MKNVKQVALAGGILWGGMIFLVTLANVFWGYGTAFLKVWMSIYPGFTLTVGGSIIGLIYGFLDMYIGIYIIDWVYRAVEKH